MKRQVAVLAVLLLFVASFFASHPAEAAAGDSIRLSYAGGAFCSNTSIFIPVYVTSNLSAALPFTQTVTVDGVVIGTGGGVQSAGSMSYLGSFGGSFTASQSIPYALQLVANFSGQFFVVINAVCFGGSNVVVSIADTQVGGRGIPSGFVLKTITCDTAVYDAPAGRPLATGEALKAGQTWFVNPSPIKGADGKSWTEFFPSGNTDAYIPTACVG